jgi:hypothetical protein
MNTITLVPFRGDQIEAIRMPDGTIYVSIRRICENLGVDFSGQLQKLKGYHWATVENFPTVAQDNKQREVALLPLFQLAAWLFTISPGRVAPHVVDKLKLYQLEAVDVLYRHFLGAPTIQVAPTVDPIIALHTSLLAMRQAQLDMGTQIVDLVDVAGKIVDKVDGVEAKVDRVVANQVEATRALKRLPPPSVPPPPLTLRDAIRMCVNNYVQATGMEYRDAWNQLYDAAYYRLKYDVRARTRNSRQSKLAQAEADGRIAGLYALARDLFDLDRGTPGYTPGC